MKRLVFLGLMVTIILAAADVRAADSVRPIRGAAVQGKILSISATQVEIEDRAGLTRTIPANEIHTVIFDNEPSIMEAIRKRILDGEYDTALQSLGRIDPEKAKKPDMQVEIAYLKAYAAAQLALAGGGSLPEAEKAMADFITTHTKSYHWYRANEIAGMLLSAQRKHPEAAKYYTKMSEAPWNDYKMRAGVHLGRGLLAMNRPADALKHFEAVLALRADNESAAQQRMAATLGRARCLAADKRAAEAIKDVEAIIARADGENTDLLGQAYLTLGILQRAAGKTKDAIISLLHVDLLYNSSADTHAEALYYLSLLWKAEQKPDRADRARQVLLKRYGNTQWAAGG